MFDLNWLDMVREYVNIVTMAPVFTSSKIDKQQGELINAIRFKLSQYSPEFSSYICKLYNLKYTHAFVQQQYIS